jgi:hypothetical protein
MKVSNSALLLATFSLAMLTPALAQTSQDNQSSDVSEAQRMVPVRATLTRTLDANSIHTGDQFRATLSDNAHLDGGVELHKGDVLLGKVVTDDMATAGNSRLAVRFTEVDRKNGQSLPIKATIVALYNPNQFLTDSVDQPEEFPNSWNNQTLSVDQLGVASGVDLHSRISSENSGVFVTTTKKNVKIPAGSELALAIAAQGNASSTNTGL